MREILKTYLKEISVYPLLKKEDDMELSHIIQGKSGKSGKSSKSKRQKAINTLVTSNLRFVIPIVSRYYANLKTVSFMDCLQEGSNALMKAAEKYDYDAHQVRFISYAKVGIIRHIKTALGTDRLIHLPSDHFKYQYKIEAVKSKFGVDVSNGTIMKELGLSKEYLDLILKAPDRTVADSFDAIDSIGELVDESTEGNQIQEEIDMNHLRSYLGKAIQDLPEKARLAIRRHFFDEAEQAQIARENGISKQAVNLSIERGLASLRKRMVEEEKLFEGIPLKWVKVIKGETIPIFNRGKCKRIQNINLPCDR